MISGVPAGIGVRREALPVEFRAIGAGRVTATERDAGQDLVSEPPQQVETPAGHRARGRQHGARGRRRPAYDSRTDRLPPAFAARWQHAGRLLGQRSAVGHAHWNGRKSSHSSEACVRWVSDAAELSRGSVLPAVLQQSLLLSLEHRIIII